MVLGMRKIVMSGFQHSGVSMVNSQVVLVHWIQSMSEKKRRSKLEMKFEEILIANQAEYDYEVTKISYIVPESKHTYTVDFTTTNGLLLEVKGWLSDHQERYKYVLLKQQYPDLDLRFIFDNVNKYCGGTKYTHATWCDKHGFKYCSVKDVDTIQAWLNEGSQ